MQSFTVIKKESTFGCKVRAFVRMLLYMFQHVFRLAGYIEPVASSSESGVSVHHKVAV